MALSARRSASSRCSACPPPRIPEGPGGCRVSPCSVHKVPQTTRPSRLSGLRRKTTEPALSRWPRTRKTVQPASLRSCSVAVRIPLPRSACPLLLSLTFGMRQGGNGWQRGLRMKPSQRQPGKPGVPRLQPQLASAKGLRQDSASSGSSALFFACRVKHHTPCSAGLQNAAWVAPKLGPLRAPGLQQPECCRSADHVLHSR